MRTKAKRWLNNKIKTILSQRPNERHSLLWWQNHINSFLPNMYRLRNIKVTARRINTIGLNLSRDRAMCDGVSNMFYEVLP